MKVLLINGSPHPRGNTFLALNKIAETLTAQGIESELVTIGNKRISGCIACGSCHKTGKCAFDDGANEVIEKIKECDGLIIGTPIYYSGINGTLKSFLDRAFMVASGAMRFKPAAAICVLRRSGATLALQSIHQYFAFAEMLEVPSMYWNAVHGGMADEALRDKEGMQLMEVLGNNMSYLLKLRAASDLPLPKRPDKIQFNYVR